MMIDSSHPETGSSLCSAKLLKEEEQLLSRGDRERREKMLCPGQDHTVQVARPSLLQECACTGRWQVSLNSRLSWRRGETRNG